MISYAQNAEDVVLARVFAGQGTGRYVDIGAGDPVLASVTNHFYEQGWSGVNVEPIPAKAQELRQARPRDVTVAVAVGAEPGKATLHVVADEWGWSTLDGELAREYRRDRRWRVDDVEVEVVTLADLLGEHPGEVDFLKIDVEGAEREVIAGADWTRHRPRVLVVEATRPGSPVPAHEQWEPLLLEVGYRCALFDGLNRFYARADDAEALARLAAPANVFDEFEPHEVARQRAVLERLPTARAAEVTYIQRLERNVREAQQVAERHAEHAAKLEAAVARERQGAARTARYVAALESRIAELESQLNQGERPPS
ncbi:FkbM family methyltransferase [Qaidamihabitans albus]|uniref:FkbM family methyltransferase n=1 Tax=Qaidamihabitans albus TaxID=2795733 RepID=UPI0018F18B59|nr:FkbM family methyltransferase [Qaidamihabitans albus]